MLLSPDVWRVTLRCLSRQDIVEEVTSDYIREKLWSASEDLLVRFEATTLGPALREEFEARKAFLYEQTESVVKIQVRESPTTVTESCPVVGKYLLGRQHHQLPAF